MRGGRLCPQFGTLHLIFRLKRLGYRVTTIFENNYLLIQKVSERALLYHLERAIARRARCFGHQDYAPALPGMRHPKS